MLKITQNEDHRGIREYTFRSPNRIGLQRDLPSYCHHNQGSLGMSLKDFLARRRMSEAGTPVTFR